MTLFNSTMFKNLSEVLENSEQDFHLLLSLLSK